MAASGGRGLWIALACIAWVILLVVGFGYYWWTQHGDAVMGDTKDALAEGRTLGQDADEQTCLAETLERHRTCGRGISCAVPNLVFLEACLEPAASSPGFCGGVPGPTAVFESARWSKRRCSDAGFSDSTCPQIFARVQHYCATTYAGGADDAP